MGGGGSSKTSKTKHANKDDYEKAGGRGGGGWSSGNRGGGGERHNASYVRSGPLMDSRIQKLCNESGIACVPADFDNLVKDWFRDFEKKRGSEYLGEAFEHLAEWLAKKERDQVKKWNKHIMVFLRNWEQQRFEEAR